VLLCRPFNGACWDGYLTETSAMPSLQCKYLRALERTEAGLPVLSPTNRTDGSREKAGKSVF